MLGFIVNLFISLGLVTIGVNYFIRSLRYKKKFSPIISTVIAIETEIDSDTFVKYPIIKYIANGQEFSTKVDFGMTIFQWKKGDEIRILYNPLNPKDFIVDEFKVKLLSWIMIIAGSIFCLLGFYYL